MRDTIRVFAVDDEALARARVRSMLECCDGVELVGEAADGASAVRQIDELRPDVVLLDMEMAGMNGLDVLATAAHKPAVVFTTAHDRYAVAAFEVEAADYLLKPFGAERLRKAIERARQRLPEAGASPYLTRLLIRERGGIIMLPVRQVEWFEARDDYVRVHAAGARHLIHVTISELERRVDPTLFMRIHRSHMINLDCIAAIHRAADGRLTVELRSGTRLNTSRSRAAALRRIGL
jgi:DNA-binding LytR/AlgR family response regulator